MVLRAFYEHQFARLKLVAINSPATVDHCAHLISYDSVHGRFLKEISTQDQTMIIDGQKITYSRERDPNKAGWDKLDVDIVLECSGKFNDAEQASAHLKAGAKKVLISAPAKGAVKNCVFGVNHQTLKPQDQLISNASCTTNALAPLIKAIDDRLPIENGYMTTIHAYTNDQNNLDNSHRDLRRARACALSMIPTTTGAASMVGKIMPHLQGRIDGTAIRVPVANVSLIDFVCTLDKSPSLDPQSLNKIMREASEGYMKGILGYSHKPLVSIDFNHSSEMTMKEAIFGITSAAFGSKR
ncbi:MAG: glyceraldehyde 3-phosphate dehydrogenase NAD-binding domain-containing protein, partial [Pseudomonadota bacterium]